MSDDWGNDPIQPDTAPQPQATDWGNDPIVGAKKYKFSDTAINRALGRPGTTTIYMHPDQYLALTPDLPSNPKTDRKGASLKKSLDAGDDVDEVPSLEVTVDKTGTAKVTDQDGRHRALFAKEAGLDLIPVAVQRFGTKAPIKALAGMREGTEAVPFNFKPVMAPPTPKAAAPKKTAGLYEEISQGIADPIVGAEQLIVHGVAAATGAPKFAEATDKSIAAEEGQYQSARRNALAGKDPGFDWGRLAGNIASPVNLLPLGAVSKAGTAARLTGPILSRIVQGVARSARTTGLGGAVIAALNPVTDGDFWSEKTKQAAVGLVAGTVAPPVFGAAAKAVIKVGSATLAPIIRFVSGVKGPNAVLSAAEQTIMKRLSDGVEGGGPTAQDMLELAGKTPDKPITLMDVGSRPVNALAGRTYREGGAAGQRVRNFLTERTSEQGLRLEGDVEQNVSRETAHQTVEAMQHSRANAAAPLYEKAYAANQNMQSATIDRILKTPAGQAALKAARVKMQNDMTLLGHPDPDLAEQIAESGQQVPFRGGVASGLKLRTLDYVKRSMDDMIGAARRAGENDNARILTGLKKQLVGEIDAADVTARAGPNSTKPEGGLYKQARAAYSGPSQSIEALEFGQNAFKPSTGTDELSAEFSKLNANDKEFARIGLAQALRDKIGSKDVGTNAARQMARNPAMQKRLRVFFETEAAYKKFIDAVTSEDLMFRTQGDVIGGSQTAERMAEDSDQGAEALGHAAKAVIHMHMGNPIGAGWSLKNAFAAFSRQPDPELADQISRVLTAPFNEPGSHGVRLLRNFAAVAPGTRNYLSQAANRAGRGVGMVSSGVTGGQAGGP